MSENGGRRASPDVYVRDGQLEGSMSSGDGDKPDATLKSLMGPTFIMVIE